MDDATTGTSFRCAPWTAALGADPIGSATVFDRLLVVEVGLPWPADIADAELLRELEVAPGTRVQGVVPDVDRGSGQDVLVTRWRRHGSILEGHDLVVPRAELIDTLHALDADDDGRFDLVDAPPEILICAHGARDICCGGPGTRLATEARAELASWRVRRTSHLGGHRFAPTALTLPDGRCWAHLDLPLLASIAERTASPATVRSHYRGNTALPPAAQVVEAEHLSANGWIDPTAMHATVTTDGAHSKVRLDLTTPPGAVIVEADVAVIARHPVLKCGFGPEHAEKDSPEYAIVR